MINTEFTNIIQKISTERREQSFCRITEPEHLFIGNDYIYPKGFSSSPQSSKKWNKDRKELNTLWDC